MYLVSEEAELYKLLSFNAHNSNVRGSHDTLERSDGETALPSQPRIPLGSRSELLSYLQSHLAVDVLDKVSTPFYGHISPLHHQTARNRSIIATEKPHLHLVWYYDRIFVKPIPPYLLSAAFWQYLNQGNPDLVRAAAGFLRSYAFLIQYERDFKIAQSDSLGLIPKEDGESTITFERFVRFIQLFEQLKDADVSPRYHFGELRLSRLNTLAPFLFSKLTFHHMHAQWSALLSKVFAFHLTVFLVLNTVLSAMQVGLQAQATEPASYSDRFAVVCNRFSLGVVLFVVVVVASYFSFGVFMMLHDALFSSKVVITKRSTDPKKKPENLTSNAV